MNLTKIEVIDFEGKHKITFDFVQSRNLLPYTKPTKSKKKLNKCNIKVKGKIFRQEKLTNWVF